MTDPGEPTASGYMNVANPRVRVDVLLLSSGLCQESGAGEKPGPFPWLTVGPGISPDRASPYCNLAWLRGLTGRFFVRVPITAGGECHPAPKDGLRQGYRSRPLRASPGRLLLTWSPGVSLWCPNGTRDAPVAWLRNQSREPGRLLRAELWLPDKRADRQHHVVLGILRLRDAEYGDVCHTTRPEVHTPRGAYSRRGILQEGTLPHLSRLLVNSLL